MPPLQLFGRSWHVSSDDLVLPGFVGVLFHFTWSGLIIVDAALIGLPDDCSQRRLATGSVLILLLSFVLTTCLQVWVTLVAARGAMLEEYKRRSMSSALYLLLTAYCLEAAALTLTTVVFHGVIGKDTSCYTTEELARTAMADLAVQNWFIYTTWAALGTVGGLLVLLYNIYPDRSLDAWVDRVTCLSYVFCCWRSLGVSNVSANMPTISQSASSTPTVLRLAKVLGDVFYPLNFSFTDIVAAITLVGITHRSRAHGTGSSSHTHAVIAAAAAGLFQNGRPGEGAYAEAAAALAAAESEERAAAMPAGCLGSEVSDRGNVQQQAMGSCAPAAAAEVPQSSSSGSPKHESKIGAAVTGLPVTKSHQQLLQLLLDDAHDQQQQPGTRTLGQPHHAAAVSVDDALVRSQRSVQHSKQDPHQGSWVSAVSPGAASTYLLRLPSAMRSRLGGAGMQRASSDGDVFRLSESSGHSGVHKRSLKSIAADPGSASGAAAASISSIATGLSSSAAGAVETPARNNSISTVSQGSSYSSVWEQAVRQASTLAIAPGYGIHPAGKPILLPATQPTPPKVSRISNRYSEEPMCKESEQLLHSGGASRAYSWAGEAHLPTQEAERHAPEASDIVCPAQPAAGGVAQLLPSELGQTALQDGTSASSIINTGCTRDFSGLATHGPRLASLKPTKHVSFDDDSASGVAATAATAAEPKRSPSEDAAASSHGAVEGEDDAKSWSFLELLEEALHWHRYANAIYGWPMFLWSHRYRVLRCCGLCCGRCFKCVQRKVQASNSTMYSNAISSSQPWASVSAEAASCSAAGQARGQRSYGPVAEGIETNQEGTDSFVVGQGTVKQQPQPEQPQPEQPQPKQEQLHPVHGLPATSDSSRAIAGTSLIRGPGTEQCQQRCCSVVHEAAAMNDSHVTPALHSPQNGPVPNDGMDLQKCSGSIALASTERCAGLGSQHEQQHYAQHDKQQSTAVEQPLTIITSKEARMHDLMGSSTVFTNNLSAASLTAGVSNPGDSSTLAAGQHTCSHQAPADAATSVAPGTAAFSSSHHKDATAGFGSCCGCLDGIWGTSHVPKMAPLTASQRLTREAIIQTAKIPDSALLYVSYSNLVEGLLPYSVVLDEARQCVVLAIRGSLSVEDCVTDVLYDPAPLDADWLQPATAVESTAGAGRAGAAGKEVTSSSSAPAVHQQAKGLGCVDEQQPASTHGVDRAVMGESDVGSLDTHMQPKLMPRQSPFATAAAAAVHAAEDSSHGQPAEDPVLGSYSHQQQPSIPVAQAAAAAAAASAVDAGSVEPLELHCPCSADRSNAHWQQQQQQHADKLNKQPSFWRTRLPTYQSCDFSSTQQQQQQQQQPSLTHQQQQQGVPPHANAGVRQGLLQGLSSLKTAWHLLPSVHKRCSHLDSSLLPTTQSVDFKAAHAADLTTSQSVHHSRSSTAEVQMMGQVQRTTAADRALGAARAGHRLRGTKSASSQGLWQQQQQQQQSGLDQAASVGRNGPSLCDGGPTDGLLTHQAAVICSGQTAAQSTAAAVAGGSLLPSADTAGLESAAEEQDAAAAAATAAATAAAVQADAAEKTPDTGAAGDQWFAHEGILNCARAIRHDLKRLGLLDQLLLGQKPSGNGNSWTSMQQQQQQQLQGSMTGIPVGSEQLPDCRGWTLVLTGHSLGAGVAALLALHYRSLYPNVRCWCFGPPGGLMSPAAAASLKDICYSLVSAKDMIPRMSLWTIERLRDEMMLCALRCKLPKWKLLLGAAFGRQWEEHEVLRPLDELTPTQGEQYRRYRRAVNEERSLDPLRVRIAREFVPPGQVIWLERYKISRPRIKLTVPAAADADTAEVVLNMEHTKTHSAPAAINMQASSHTAEAEAAPVHVTAPTRSTVMPAQRSAKAPSTSQTAVSSNMIRASSAALAAALAAAPAAVAGTVTVNRLQPHVTDGLNLIVGGMVVSRNMFLDHVPDAQIAELKRLVRRMRRQRDDYERRGLVQRRETTAAAAAFGSIMAPMQHVMPQRLPT